MDAPRGDCGAFWGPDGIVTVGRRSIFGWTGRGMNGGMWCSGSTKYGDVNVERWKEGEISGGSECLRVKSSIKGCSHCAF